MGSKVVKKGEVVSVKESEEGGCMIRTETVRPTKQRALAACLI